MEQREWAEWGGALEKIDHINGYTFGGHFLSFFLFFLIHDNVPTNIYVGECV